MSTAAAPAHATTAVRSDPAAQAYLLLRVVFVLAPIVFGLDKFAGVLTDDWTRYLAPEFNDLIPGSAATAMHIVGVVEIAAGLVVLLTPRWGALLVGGYGDVAMRDFGLLAGALALNRLATARRER